MSTYRAFTVVSSLDILDVHGFVREVRALAVAELGYLAPEFAESDDPSRILECEESVLDDAVRWYGYLMQRRGQIELPLPESVLRPLSTKAWPEDKTGEM